MLTDKEIEDFKRELKSLLEKYDVSIGAQCDETQGVTGEQMYIAMNKHPWKDIFIVNGWEIESEDLTEKV